jgi:CRP/FNR family cyclic AMP-dependent transcriptional regulator
MRLAGYARDPAWLVAALSRVPLFSGLDDRALIALASTARTRRFRRGEVIFRQGDPGDGMHVIVTGRVKISSTSDDGAEAILATLPAGDFFGTLALLDGAPRSAAATALGTTETLTLPRDPFLALLDAEPAIRAALMAALAREIRRLTTQVEELHFLDIAGRLAANLARMARETGVPEPDGAYRLDGPLTQGELAAMVGSTRQSVNRLLGLLVTDGLIQLERDAIVVLDIAGLDRAARR